MKNLHDRTRIYKTKNAKTHTYLGTSHRLGPPASASWDERDLRERLFLLSKRTVFFFDAVTKVKFRLRLDMISGFILVLPFVFTFITANLP